MARTLKQGYKNLIKIRRRMESEQDDMRNAVPGTPLYNLLFFPRYTWRVATIMPSDVGMDGCPEEFAQFKRVLSGK